MRAHKVILLLNLSRQMSWNGSFRRGPFDIPHDAVFKVLPSQKRTYIKERFLANPTFRQRDAWSEKALVVAAIDGHTEHLDEASLYIYIYLYKWGTFFPVRLSVNLSTYLITSFHISMTEQQPA